MKQAISLEKFAQKLSWLILLILALVPFHAFLTVWLSSAVGHYTILRLWKEYLLVPIVLGALLILVKDKAARAKFIRLRLVQLIFAYFALLLICGFVALGFHGVTKKAMFYGLLVDSRFLIFFLATLVISSQTRLLADSWRKVLIGPAVLVSAFAVLQFLVLPYDFLKHFGYSAKTIFPYETINHNIHHLRVFSFLRGANPLGAFLILPLSVMAAGILKLKNRGWDALVLAAGFGAALIFSFSRSGWIGAAVALAVISLLAIKKPAARQKLLWVIGGLAIIAVAVGLLLRNNLSFENFVLHTDRASKIAVSSNQGHSSAAKDAAKDIVHHPLGTGVGTAGPQSVYNRDDARIAENYYLQIGQEAGVIGAILFILINIGTAKLLYLHRADPLALALFASLIGLAIVGLLSHVWSDDTLAYAWWGLAGICLGADILKHKGNGRIPKTT